MIDNPNATTLSLTWIGIEPDSGALPVVVP